MSGKTKDDAGKQVTKEQFQAYIQEYLQRSQLDYLPSTRSYTQTVDDLYQRHADFSEKISLTEVLRALDSIDGVLFDPPLQGRVGKGVHGNKLPPGFDGCALTAQAAEQNAGSARRHQWLQRKVDYCREHVQYLCWVLFLALVYCGMCIWMVFTWKDSLLSEGQALGWQLVTAKCGAQMMKVSFMLLPLMVVRGIHTWLETHNLSWLIPKERMLRLHKLVGHAAMTGMLMHVISHIFTYTNAYTGGREYIEQAVEGLDEDERTKILKRVEDGWLLQSKTFITGVILLSFMLTIWLYAARWPRTSPRLKKYLPRVHQHLNHYTSFARTHLLYVPIFVLLYVHVLPQLPAGDASHDTWLWISVSIALFAVDKLYRTWHQQARQSYVTQVAVLPGRVVALRFARPAGFVYSPGMYVNVRLPGTLQAHPFTLSSAPSDPWLRVHVRVVGDWTAWMHDRLLQAGIDWEMQTTRARVWRDILYVESAASTPAATPRAGSVSSPTAGAFGAPVAEGAEQSERGVVVLEMGALVDDRSAPSNPRNIGEDKSDQGESADASGVGGLGSPTTPARTFRWHLPGEHASSSNAAEEVPPPKAGSPTPFAGAAGQGPPTNLGRSSAPLQGRPTLYTNSLYSNQPQAPQQMVQLLPEFKPQELSRGSLGSERNVIARLSRASLPTFIPHLARSSAPAPYQLRPQQLHTLPSMAPGTVAEQDTERVRRAQEALAVSPMPPDVFVDGPYTSPLAGILTKGRLAVMVASGSGVTPFQGVIRQHLHNLYATWATHNAHREVEKKLGKHGHLQRQVTLGAGGVGSGVVVQQHPPVQSDGLQPWVRCYDFNTPGDGGRGPSMATALGSPQKLVLVWVVRYYEWVTWLEEELHLLSGAPDEIKAAFQILIFVTQPGEPDPDSWRDAQAAQGLPTTEPPPRLSKEAKAAAFLCQKLAAQQVAREHQVAVVLEGGRPKWSHVLGRVLAGKRPEELHKCGVFLCGGKAIASAVRDACGKGVEVAGKRVRPRFFTENFY